MTNTISVKESEYDLDSGFFWVITEDDLTIQCCLSNRKDGKGSKKQIKRSYIGHDEGLSADANEEAFLKYGEDACLDTLLCYARACGIKIVSGDE